MRVAVVQTSPVLGARDTNIARATDLLSRLPQEQQLDLIVLPELAFTGYNFQSAQEIGPFVETNEVSPSRDWAQDVAKRFRCSVVVGFPLQDDEGPRYNTAVLVDREGNVAHQYHKHFMFSTDYKWGCQPGPGFSWKQVRYGDETVRTSIGICMDLNPKEYLAPFDLFEYATFVLENDVRLIILPMAWLLPVDADRKLPSIGSVEYWITRLGPLIKDKQVRTVIVCNRTGEERDAVYAGTSCVLQMGRGHVRVIDRLAREEEVLAVGLTL